MENSVMLTYCFELREFVAGEVHSRKVRVQTREEAACIAAEWVGDGELNVTWAFYPADPDRAASAGWKR